MGAPSPQAESEWTELAKLQAQLAVTEHQLQKAVERGTHQQQRSILDKQVRGTAASASRQTLNQRWKPKKGSCASCLRTREAMALGQSRNFRLLAECRS
jgi:hypothetical protein